MQKKLKKQVLNEISQHILDSKTFSLTLDEWTSIKNRRYMNINVHTSDTKFWNLGLCRIYGSMPADKCLIIIENKLKEFGISLKSIISITTDGASVMKKTVKLTDANHQLCLAHGIQLAVIQVLYNKNNFEEIEDLVQEPVQLPNIQDCDNSDSDEDDENNGELLHIEQAVSNTSPLTSLQDVELRFLITKIRKVIKIFRKSPTKNDDILQKHVKEELGRNIILFLK